MCTNLAWSLDCSTHLNKADTGTAGGVREYFSAFRSGSDKHPRRQRILGSPLCPGYRLLRRRYSQHSRRARRRRTGGKDHFSSFHQFLSELGSRVVEVIGLTILLMLKDGYNRRSDIARSSARIICWDRARQGALYSGPTATGRDIYPACSHLLLNSISNSPSFRKRA